MTNFFCHKTIVRLLNIAVSSGGEGDRPLVFFIFKIFFHILCCTCCMKSSGLHAGRAPILFLQWGYKCLKLALFAGGHIPSFIKISEIEVSYIVCVAWSDLYMEQYLAKFCMGVKYGLWKKNINYKCLQKKCTEKWLALWGVNKLFKVVVMGEIINEYRILVGKCLIKCLLRILRRRWENSTVMHHRKLGCEGGM